MMRRFQLIILPLVLLLTSCTTVPQQDQPSVEPVSATPPPNPLIVPFNEPIDFASLKTEHIAPATDYAIATGDKMLVDILSVPDEDRTFENTIQAKDDLFAFTNRIMNPIGLMSEVHPDASLRTACDSALIKYSQWENALVLNEDLYKTVVVYKETAEAKALTGLKKKFLADILKEYHRLGFDLPKEKRDSLKVIKDRIDQIGLEFDKNITDYTDTLIVTEEDMAGLPEWYKKEKAVGHGLYKIDISRPSRMPFMRYSKSESARRDLTEKYLNRAADKNLKVIPKLVQEHQNLAHVLGYRSYAEYLLEDRMPKTPEVVWSFEKELRDNLRRKAQAEHDELVAIKRELTGKDDDEINYWNMFYYENILDERKYQLNNELIKEYFELNNVRQGLFAITQKLLGLEYRPVENLSVWHPDVTMYAVYDTKSGKKLGYFYLDLYPREGKYSHAAHFSIRKGKRTADGYQYPMAALVCNFPKPTPERPSLLRHGPNGEVETFFHEFGHLLHGMVTTVDYWTYSGTSVDRDFVEAPSQIFENWIWEKESLKLFARHYQTGEVIPDTLLDKMLAAKNRSSGGDYSFQVFLGMLDLTLYDQWDPQGAESVLDVARRLHNEILTWKETPGTARIASFGHLNGYAASYYGYAWARVLAQDMFSVFKQEGILNPDVGLRFREEVLAPGGSQEPMDLVRTFLGREPNTQALVESLGL